MIITQSTTYHWELEVANPGMREDKSQQVKGNQPRNTINNMSGNEIKLCSYLNELLRFREINS